ncbi:MAG TPA: AraC family transcriptional regulator ligand-binding domain-containing protein [Polyangiales bacterium]
MDFDVAPGVPSYSMRLVRPFLRVLGQSEKLRDRMLARLEELDPDERVPIFTAHQLLERAEALLSDPALGLRASLELGPGDLGAMDYALASAETVEQSLNIATRYARLINDAMVFSRELVDGRLFVRLSNLLVLPRAAAEFQLSAVLKLREHAWPGELSSDLDVWLMGEPPADLSLHQRAFGAARIHFGSPFYGFSFAAAKLPSRLRATDPNLNDVMRKHLELVLGTLPQLQSYTERVRSLLIRELSGGDVSAAHLAKLMHTSLSTLGRRLEGEGTTFSAILDDLRRRLALGYLASRQLSVPEVALLTGFSQATAFHRAFRRWTGKTPLQYRRERLRLDVGPEQAGV